MQSPVKKIFITQIFGVNKVNYEKYGLQGHNGIDYRAFLPDGERCYEGEKSEVFSPHHGTVTENAFDTSFGWYIKIENDQEGSVLAHLSSQSKCQIGSGISQGQFIGYQGTTGNSTGIHLHWGYYKTPRDRNNGFNGYINQEGMYEPYKEGAMYTEEQMTAVRLERDKNWNLYQETLKQLPVEFSRGFEEGKKVGVQPPQPPQSIEVSGSRWELNGLLLVDGKYQGNYKKV